MFQKSGYGPYLQTVERFIKHLDVEQNPTLSKTRNEIKIAKFWKCRLPYPNLLILGSFAGNNSYEEMNFQKKGVLIVTISYD